jgi:cobalt-zinc-cadmium efflux system outer membrane protein
MSKRLYGLQQSAIRLLVILALLAVGCEGVSSPRLLKPVEAAATTEEEHAASEVAVGKEEPLDLAQLLALAAANHPDLAVAQARSEAARGRLIQAGLYPNPTLVWEADEMGFRHDGGGTQGPVVNQTIITGHKLRYATEAAAAGLAAADWQAMTRWYEVVTRVRLAYYDLLTALGELQVSREVLKLAEDALAAAKKLQAAGTGTQPDLLRAEVEVEQSRLRLDNADQRARAVWKALAIAVGVPDMQHREIAGTMDIAIPQFEWQPVVTSVLTRSSEVQEAEANVAQAERLERRAVAQRVPDITLSVRPFYSYPDHQGEIRVEAGAPLPIFNRNQGNIVAARADLERAEEEVRQVELRLTERLTAAFLRYRQARQQVKVYQSKVIRTAEESLRLVRKGYESGDPKYDFTAVLQAQQTLAQAGLAYVQALGNAWRAVSEIMGMLQDEEAGCAAAPDIATAPAPGEDWAHPVATPRCRVTGVRMEVMTNEESQAGDSSQAGHVCAPPSTRSTWPLINRPSSEAKNATTDATSCGRP